MKLALISLALLAAGAEAAQNYPVTQAQRGAAEKVAQAGVALSDLKSDAPESYVVKRGDTLWGISSIFLTSPWRWPELWGMNMDQVRNPHLIYPGQQLTLDKANGRARLRFGGPLRGGLIDNSMPVVRISPETRYEALGDNALPTLNPALIEPFLAEPLIVEEATFSRAPRIVAAQQERVLITRGDRAYARSENSPPLAVGPGLPKDWRVFRRATPLKDPGTGEILGWEAHYVGKATLVRGENAADSVVGADANSAEIVPATIDIIAAKEEMRVGDRLLPEPPRQLVSYSPRAPLVPIEGGRIVSVYGSAVVNAAQNQVVAINRGTRDGIESGHVLAILSNGGQLVDKTDSSKPTIRLPDERNGLLLVFRPFERVSYALIVQTL
ncbi:MAG: LysM domain-containing protein, partial [Burkholderiales bacterium]